MVVDQKIPIEQYIPRLKNWCFFFFVKFCMYVTIFFFHMIHKKLKDPEGTKLCYTITKYQGVHSYLTHLLQHRNQWGYSVQNL